MVTTTVQLHPFRKSFFSTILYLFGGYLTADSTSSSTIIATSLLPSSPLTVQSGGGGGGSAGSGAGSASNGTSGNGNGPTAFTGAAAPRSAMGFNWWGESWGWIIAAGVIACVGAVVVE